MSQRRSAGHTQHSLAGTWLWTHHCLHSCRGACDIVTSNSSSSGSTAHQPHQAASEFRDMNVHLVRLLRHWGRWLLEVACEIIICVQPCWGACTSGYSSNTTD